MENNAISLTEQQLEGLLDEELTALSQKGSEEATNILINRYKPLIKKLTRKYFIYRGLDNDDLMQEATLAFVKAISWHDATKNNLFKTFAFHCIDNKLRDVVRKCNSLNNVGFNATLSMTELDGNETEKITDTSVSDPLTQAIQNEAVEKIHKIAQEELSKKQYDVLMLFLEGYSYAEIMQKLNLKNTKQVDNALASAKRTLRELLND